MPKTTQLKDDAPPISLHTLTHTATALFVEQQQPEKKKRKKKTFPTHIEAATIPLKSFNCMCANVLRWKHVENTESMCDASEHICKYNNAKRQGNRYVGKPLSNIVHYTMVGWTALCFGSAVGRWQKLLHVRRMPWNEWVPYLFMYIRNRHCRRRRRIHLLVGLGSDSKSRPHSVHVTSTPTHQRTAHWCEN